MQGHDLCPVPDYATGYRLADCLQDFVGGRWGFREDPHTRQLYLTLQDTTLEKRERAHYYVFGYLEALRPAASD